MKKKIAKRWQMFGLIIILVGGLVHLLKPVNIDILNLFGGVRGIVQFLAGAISIWYAIWGIRKLN